MIDENCDTDDIVYNLATFCGKANCDLSLVVGNIQKNIFKFIGTLNSLAELFTGVDPDYYALTDAFNKYNIIGVAIGSTLRMLFNYQN